MNIGQKINALFERSGYKNYADWGKAMGLPGDWLLDMKKRDSIKTVDITRLITICDYNHISLDDLFKDNDNKYIIDMNSDLGDNDICKLLSYIQELLQKDDTKFNGYIMGEKSREFADDAIDVLKKLIKNNL